MTGYIQFPDIIRSTKPTSAQELYSMQNNKLIQNSTYDEDEIKGWFKGIEVDSFVYICLISEANFEDNP